MKLSRAIVIGTIILAMVAGLRYCDQQGYFSNPMDKVPSVDINR